MFSKYLVTALVTLISLIAATELCAQTKPANGDATYYGNKFHGRRTSDGSTYHRDSLTCAHRTLPFGTILRVKNKRNGKEVLVKVTDRGPFRRGGVVDLSLAAAKKIDMVAAGVVPVDLEIATRDEYLAQNNHRTPKRHEQRNSANTDQLGLLADAGATTTQNKNTTTPHTLTAGKHNPQINVTGLDVAQLAKAQPRAHSYNVGTSASATASAGSAVGSVNRGASTTAPTTSASSRAIPVAKPISEASTTAQKTSGKTQAKTAAKKTATATSAAAMPANNNTRKAGSSKKKKQPASKGRKDVATVTRRNGTTQPAIAAATPARAVASTATRPRVSTSGRA